ncbi:hypothetical protein PF010_g31921 [Phytophthora fragariae]|uniref:Uncharacterized protein n=1 Tax=Phytophthora fragariae TaxID=53985 RepID=A0A6A3PJZ1_9STRA|nr:hypothetical protein PF010_g31921 [Phytophthora fragariae]KAE9058744.1 hypothetical protein PF007_g31191 [Phytophthora fragariae]
MATISIHFRAASTLVIATLASITNTIALSCSMVTYPKSSHLARYKALPSSPSTCMSISDIAAVHTSLESIPSGCGRGCPTFIRWILCDAWTCTSFSRKSSSCIYTSHLVLV